MARVGTFNAAVISDQETDELTRLIEETESNVQMKEEIKKWKEKNKEMEEEHRLSTIGTVRHFAKSGGSGGI